MRSPEDAARGNRWIDAAYLALTLDGTDTLLMAADHALRRELSRRGRENLIRLSVVTPDPPSCPENAS